jgi:hypothetical protein
MWICITICRDGIRRKAAKVAKRNGKKTKKSHARISSKKKPKTETKKETKKSKKPKPTSDEGSDPQKPPADRASTCCHCGEVHPISAEGYGCKCDYILTAYVLYVLDT